jgi:hypothetical protein
MHAACPVNLIHQMLLFSNLFYGAVLTDSVNNWKDDCK